VCIFLFNVDFKAFTMTMAGMEGAQSMFLDAVVAIQLVGGC